MEVQVKLLRVLEEQKFERLGSPHSIRVNLRIAAATHRNLEQHVSHMLPLNVVDFELFERVGCESGGKSGAAEILGLQPTTLEGRMMKLGLTRPRIA